MTGHQELESFAVRSYRYLRLSIVVVVVALVGSVLYERAQVDCWQESISAYYYTPVRAVLVGALLVAGVSLVVVRGSTDWEDALLNVAGVLAPIVAFVPTAPSPLSCASATFDVADRGAAEAFIENNVVAYVLGGAVAIVVTVVVARRGRRGPEIDAPAGLGLALAATLLAGGVLWYGAFRQSFLEHAHGAAAVAMFTLVFVVIVINALSAGGRYRKIYAATAIAMAVAAIAAVAGQLVAGPWRHQVLWLEVGELVPFAAFWAVQTVEHWAGGVPTGTERTARAACIPGVARIT